MNHDETQFASDVMAWLEEHAEPDDIAQLAAYFEVSVSTVERWSRGMAVPHPRLRTQVRKRMKAIAP